MIYIISLLSGCVGILAGGTIICFIVCKKINRYEDEIFELKKQINHSD